MVSSTENLPGPLKPAGRRNLDSLDQEQPKEDGGFASKSGSGQSPMTDESHDMGANNVEHSEENNHVSSVLF